MANTSDNVSHDYNARNKDKIKSLIRKHQFLGYGIFWAIIEDLYNNANALRLDYEGIAFDMRVDESVIKSIINDFGLFAIDGDYFGSLSVQRRIDEREIKSKKAIESARKRWDKIETDANALPMQSEGNAIKESKGKEIKESKSIFVAPLLSEVELYFKESGFNAQYAKHVFDYYALNDWKDASGKKVKSWKQKMKGVWLSEEKRKPNNQINQPTSTIQERFFKNGIEMIRTADGGAVSVIEFNKMFG